MQCLSSDVGPITSLNKNLISFASFNSYFETGVLNYEEQTIRKIRKIFSQFDTKEEVLPLSTEDFIGIYETICALDEESVERSVRCINHIQSELDCLDSQLKDKANNKVENPERLLQRLGEKLSDDNQFISELTGIHKINKADLVQVYGEQKTSTFLDLFSIKRQANAFTYYNDESPLQKRPLVEVEDGIFFITFQPLIIEAIYRYINDTVSQNSKLSQKKNAAVENVVKNLFEDIFGDSAEYIRNVCEKPGTDEHDILILFKNYILIIEVKGSKVRVPLFNPEKNYVRVRDHFDSERGIGYAYKQAIKLKKALESSPSIVLYRDYQKPFTISASGKKIIPIVITLESFGQIEINTSMLIAPEGSQPYPWACCIDDLENLIKINKYLNKDANEFIRYIKFRQKFHERIYAGDELEILECFYHDVFRKHDFDTCILEPSGKSLIDKIHFEELGVPYEYKFSITPRPMNDAHTL